MKLIVGLGNPGENYKLHRHNVGFQIVDLLAEDQGHALSKKEKNAYVAKVSCLSESLLLAKPQTWMNLSGASVAELVRYYKIELEDLIVVHDEIDLSLGELRWVFDGGHAGHNGVRSIIEELGSRAFYRLRVGVGRSQASKSVAHYVLEPFADDEKEEAIILRKRSVASINDFLKHGLDWVRQRYH